MGRDVAVVGAGPTGLTLACGLRSAGISVRVLDAVDGPATTSRALGLQPRGVEVLARLGALGDLPERGLPIRVVDVVVEGRPLARLNVGQPTRLGGPRALLISQAEIERALRDRLAALGGHVEWGRRVVALDQSSEGVTLLLDDGASVPAAWVVGADGAHSVVRKAAAVGFPGVPLVEQFLLADVHANLNRPHDAVAVWLRGNRMLAAFPLPGDVWRLMAPAPSTGPTNAEPADIAGVLADQIADEAGGAVTDVLWTSSFRIQRRLADAYRCGRVLLAGDAAHIHSPFGGQGMNTGIGDAENLAWKLALVTSGRADTALLDTYGAERRPVAEDVLASTTALTRVVFGQGRASRLLRDRVAVPLMNRPWVQRRIAEKSSQLQLSYRHGPLGARRLAGLRPGDRVPDRLCTRPGDATERLHATLGRGWALLGPASLADIAAQRLGKVTALDDARDPAMLVRPDGHLAWRGSKPASLRAWLDAALGRPARQEALSP